ncbi:MAG: cytochrome P450 [Acidimicrobiales bacterium]
MAASGLSRPCQAPPDGEAGSGQGLAHPVSAALFTADGLADPFPLYARLRASERVAWVEPPQGEGSWMVTRFEDAHRVLTSRSFSSDPVVGGSPDGHEPGSGPLSRVMTNCDAPRHTVLRDSVKRYFAASRVAALRPRIQAVADQLIDEHIPSGRMDLAGDFAYALPMTIILELLGLPLGDAALFVEWSRVLIDCDLEMTAGEVARRSRVADHDVVSYLTAVLEDRRRQTRDDMISGLLDLDLVQADLVGLVWLVLADGFETIGSFIGNAMVALLGDPHSLMADLRADPGLLGPAVEELLRYDSPGATVRRYARQAIEIGGRRIAAGDSVIVVLTSANRDEDRFERPDWIWPRRGDQGHMAFGRGAHACFGAALARAECQIGIGTLLRRLPRLRLAVPPEQLVWRGSLMLHGLGHIPVEL